MIDLNKYNHKWVIIDKPKDISSFGVIKILRKKLKIKKIGHGGTLDPLATGILPIALGEATKTTSLIMHKPKTYIFQVNWGEQRTTDDAEGEITKTSTIIPNYSEINAILPKFIGNIKQIPPLYSAIKIKGKRACDRVRNKEDIKLSPRQIFIKKLELIDIPKRKHTTFKVECHKGTYVRSLARDIALELKTVCYVTQLQRTKIGKLEISDAISLDKLIKIDHIKNNSVFEIKDMLDDIPIVYINSMEQNKLKKGQQVLFKSSELQKLNKTILCVNQNEQPIALGYYNAGYIIPKRIFNIGKDTYDYS